MVREVRKMTSPKSPSAHFLSVLREVLGRWVAVDRTTGEPVAVADTP